MVSRLAICRTEPTLNVACRLGRKHKLSSAANQQFYGYLPTQAIELVNLRLEGTIVAKNSSSRSGE